MIYTCTCYVQDHMFVAHLPAGYLSAKILVPRATGGSPRPKLWWPAALLGSVFPDIDLFYFYLVDSCQTLHHHYVTHLPVFWLCLSLVGLWSPTTRIFFVNVFGHLVLDTIVGGVLWLWPFSDLNIVLIEVPSTKGWWVWSYIFHWSFLFEIAIIIVAAYVLLGRPRRARTSQVV